MKQIINPRKFISHVLLILMVAGMLASGLTPFAISRTAEANAASASEFEVGDHVTMGKTDAEGYTGIPYWRVLDKDDEGNYLFMSEYLWTGNGSDAGAKIKFDTNWSHNKWQESDTREWCIAFEAAVLKDEDYLTIKEISKDDPEYVAKISSYSSYTYAESKGILNNDRVHLLSVEEAVKYMPSETDRIGRLSDKTTTELWYLRSPDKDSIKRVGEILKNGKINRVASSTACGMRPVFWGRVAEDSCVSKEANSDFGTNDWTVNSLSHAYGEWTELDKEQHQRVCANDDSHVEKEAHAWDEGKVTKEATEDEEGVKTFTCTVCSATKTESIPKKDKEDPKPEPTPDIKAPGTPAPATTESYKKKTMNVKWKKVSGATSYIVAYRKAGASKWSTKTTTKTTITLTGHKDKGLYQYRVAAVKNANGKTATGKYSKIKYRYINAKTPNIKAKKKAISVSWKKDTHVTRYKIEYSTDKNMKKGVKTKYVSGSKKAATITGLKKGKRYYVRLRPIKKYKGTEYIGQYIVRSAKAR